MFHFQDAGRSHLDRDVRATGSTSRAATRFRPASTFKIPHALFALDAGVVRDEFQVFAWDGEERAIASWNRDQDLRSSMRHSVVWVYQDIALRISALEQIAFL